MNTQNIHKNHRTRLLELVENNGIENVSNYTALEFVLTYIIPRKDTNPLAHKLLDEFGSFSAVLDASTEELKSVKGVGLRTAKMLSLLPAIFERYKMDKSNKTIYLSDDEDIRDFCVKLLDLKEHEEFYLLGLDKLHKLIFLKKIKSGEQDHVLIKKAEFTRNIVNIRNIHSIVITHNHPNGTCRPSQNDIKSTSNLIDLLNAIGIVFRNHIIVGNDGIYEYSSQKMLRKSL